MAGRGKELPVPYFAQPTGITCQSTCLRMFASYLEGHVVMQCTSAGERGILGIWKDINTSTDRPSKVRNAHVNMKWWLQKHFPRLRFHYSDTAAEDEAARSIVRYIDGGFPVLVSVSHAHVRGHIILVIGYENYEPDVSSAAFKLIVHDPYGRFDPSLRSTLYGARRYEGGMSLISGSEAGPGQAVRLQLGGASRHAKGDKAYGRYYLLSGTQ
jgi:hypothetical protein